MPPEREDRAGDDEGGDDIDYSDMMKVIVNALVMMNIRMRMTMEVIMITSVIIIQSGMEICLQPQLRNCKQIN